LLKYHTYFQQEQIHVASWPNLFPVVGKMPFFNSVEACTMATHTYAIEGGAFVLLASHTQSEKGIQANGLIKGTDAPPEGGADLPDDMCHTAVTGGGFTQIIAPDGRTLAKAPSPSFEGLVYAEIDFNEIYLAKNIVDPVGQYSRPDIFNLQVNSNVNRHCSYEEKSSSFAHHLRYPELKSSVDSEDRSVNENEKKLNGMERLKLNGNC
jgi:nitrilase